jgi:transcriptional regulator with XRE-family HTH domain
MNLNVMKTLIKNARKILGLRIHQVAAHIEVDQSLVSKFESGKRLPTRTQLLKLANFLSINERELLTAWNAEKIWETIKDEPFIEESLMLVKEKRAEYNKNVRIKVAPSSQSLFSEIDTRKKALDQLRQ